MCGKDRLDTQSVQQRLQRVQVEARRLEFDQRLLETAWLVLSVFLEVFAAATNAMHFLGSVHHLEVGRKRANDFHRQRQVQVADQFGQFLSRPLVIFTAAYRTEAGILDEFEKVRPTLVPQEIANQRAENTHIVAERLVLRFEGDVLSAKFLAHGMLFVDQSRKLSYCSGRSVSASFNKAMTDCRSSRFLPLTRSLSPWIEV